MSIDPFSFGVGFFFSMMFSIIFIVISFEIRKKRAIAFTKRFSVISEGLSSLKALSFRIAGQLKRIRQHNQKNSEVINTEKLNNYLDGLNYVFDNLAAGMMPPTEEIAMEALKGKQSSSEQRAYEDGLKFRDDVRRLRQILDQNGIDGLAHYANSKQKKKGHTTHVKIVD